MRWALVWGIVLAAACGSGREPSGHAPAVGAPVLPPPPLAAGVGVAELTLPDGVPIAGYALEDRRLERIDADPSNHYALFKPAIGQHDPIRVKCLLLTTPAARLALLRLDLVMVPNNLYEEVLALAESEHALAPAGVVVAATHTHSGPGAYGKPFFLEAGTLDFFDAAILGLLLDAVRDALRDAALSLVPARIGFATGATQGLVHNRRGEPYLDPSARVLRVDGEQGPIALVWNLAVHGNALSGDNLLFSADVSGFAEAALEARTGTTALFFNGAQGDVNPTLSDKGHEPRTFEAAEAWGERLAEQVEPVWREAAAVMNPAPKLAAARVEVELGDPFVDLSTPLIDPFLHQALSTYFPTDGDRALLDGQMDERFFFHALRIGDAVALTVPGEPTTPVGQALVALAAGQGYAGGWIFGLANGYMSYVTTPQQLAAGEYEAVITLFGPDTAAKVEGAAEQALLALPP